MPASKAIMNQVLSYRLNKDELFHLLVVTCIFFLVIINRFAHFFHTLPINPDEAQAVANTLLLQQDMMTWRSVDGTSVGPLNFYFLMWPRLFDLPVTLQSARFTAAILAAITLSLAYFIGLKVLKPGLVLIPILMVLTFESLTEHPDFLHYSSEYLPSLLLMLSALFITSFIKNNNFMYPLSAMFVLGMIPFSKLQATPIAFVMGLFILGLYLYRNKDDLKTVRNKFLALILTSLIPAAIILVPLLLVNEFSTFWKSYVQWGLAYRDEPLSLASLFSLIYSSGSLIYLFLPIIILGGYCFAAYILWSKNTRNEIRLFFVFSHLVFLFSIISIVQPGRLFPHYLTLMIFSSLLVMFSFMSLLNLLAFDNKRHTAAIVYAGPILIAIYSITGIINSVKLEMMFLYKKEIFPGLFADRMFSKPNLLQWIAPPNEHLFVWGWMSQWYPFSGLTPATRETHTENQIRNNNKHSYFRKRLLSDIKNSNPAVVVDAVAANSFMFSDPDKFGIQTFPELNDYIKHNYILINEAARVDNNCPALYVKNDYLNKLTTSIITPISYKASSFAISSDHEFDVSHAFDNSIFEQCGDAWLPIQKTTGWVEVKFEKQHVGQIWILNTTGFTGQRRTNNISVKLFTDKSISYQTNLRLKPYPIWSIIDIPITAQSNKLRVDVLDYSGVGAGLNEIKIMSKATH